MASVHFRTNILLKSVIGKDLITDDNVAVLELVKNSFDANSEGATIVFENINQNDDKALGEAPTRQTSRILVKDTGRGMTLSDIENKWLNIAFSEKKATRAEFGRILAGNKGVGRFSCDRLGRYLNIYTKKAGDNFFTHLEIDWKRFEIENKIELNIQDVELSTEEIAIQDFQIITGHAAFTQGTILEISKLREHWKYDKILGLKRQLEKLINPNQAFKNNPFFIEIEAREFEKLDKGKEEYFRVNGKVSNKIFDNLNFKTSSIYCEINSSNKTIKTILSHKGQDVFTLIEANPYSLLKDVRLTVYYLNTYAKAYFTRQTGIRSFDFGSIFLFINGFRIPPYGDFGNDWLGMDSRKGQGTRRYLGTREVVGRIEINDESEDFKIISSRTGVVDNAPFEELTKSASPYGYFFKAFRRLERFVVEGLAFDSSPDILAEDSVLKAGDKWDESQEVYVENSLTKNKRIISIIRKIIDIRSQDIVSLDINENFVDELIEEQLIDARQELERITNELTSSDLSAQHLSLIRDKISSKLAELEQFSESLTIHTGSSAVIHDSSYQTVQTQYKHLYEQLTVEVSILKEKLGIEEAERARLEAEHAAEKKRLEDELEAEKKSSLFNKKLSNTDIVEVVSLQHHIDRSADKINSNISDLISGIEQDVSKAALLKYVDRISLESRKISSIVQFVTNANFNLNATTIKKDLNRFIREYILNVHQEYDYLKLNRQIMPVNIKTDSKEFVRPFRPLEIIMVIDNLFSNAFKAKAQHIDITLEINDDNQLEFTFSDDGPIGIPDEVLPRIFDLGFTTSKGSGIGMHHIKQIITSIKGTIEVDNKVPKGVTFKILIPNNP